jgi:hypothetical protein
MLFYDESVPRKLNGLCGGSSSTRSGRLEGGGSPHPRSLGSHRLARCRPACTCATSPRSRPCLSGQRRSRGGAFPFASQDRPGRTRTCCRRTLAPFSSCAGRVLCAFSRACGRTPRRARKLDAGATSFREANGDRLLRRARAVLSLAHMPDLFVDELASLCRWRLPFPFCLPGAFKGLLLRHDLHHLSIGLEALDLGLQAFGGGLPGLTALM